MGSDRRRSELRRVRVDALGGDLRSCEQALRPVGRRIRGVARALGGVEGLELGGRQIIEVADRLTGDFRTVVWLSAVAAVALDSSCT